MWKILVLLLGMAMPSAAQLNFRAGTLVYLDYNAYHWYKRPHTPMPQNTSVGQALNLLPGPGLGIWVGNPRHWIATVEAKADYFPLSLNLKRFNGLGALSLTALARLVCPLSVKHGVCPYMGLGGGVQWNKTELYMPPSHTPFFTSYVVEVDMGLGSGWGSGDHSTRFVGAFFRGGISVTGALTINLGVRIGSFFGTKAIYKRKRKPKEEPSYQAAGSLFAGSQG